jgi:tRNA threonylcarbamoyl adenosine modification protein (Sua5/YciO/YrdC/YwlC family)
MTSALHNGAATIRNGAAYKGGSSQGERARPLRSMVSPKHPRLRSCSLRTQLAPPGSGARLQARAGRTCRRVRSSTTTYAGAYQAKGCEFLTLEADGSDSWKLDQVADMLQRGAVGIIPTDTMYALVCDINNAKAVDQVYRIKDMNAKKPLSVLCRSFADIEEYTRGLPVAQSAGGRDIFKIVKDCLPGPFTLILPASKSVPKRCFKNAKGDVTCANRREVGVRIPDDPICAALLALCPAPLLTTSIRAEDVDLESGLMEPAHLVDFYAPRGLAFVVDGGVRKARASTVVDITKGDPVMVRVGEGDPALWDLHESDVDSDSPRSELYRPAEPSYN